MKRVLVTGSSRGIGRAVARRLAEDGFAVVTHAVRNAAAAGETAADCARLSGAPVQPALVFDLADRAATAAALEADMAANGPYFGVVANAGVSADAPFPILEGDAWDRVIDTDLTGLYNLLKPIVMPMVSNRIRGRIVALSSVSGVAGNRGQVNYSAAKAGVIETEMAATIEEPELVKRAIPMRRFGTPEEVAGLVAFLFRDEAAYITRQVISVNGGLF